MQTTSFFMKTLNGVIMRNYQCQYSILIRKNDIRSQRTKGVSLYRLNL